MTVGQVGGDRLVASLRQRVEQHDQRSQGDEDGRTQAGDDPDDILRALRLHVRTGDVTADPMPQAATAPPMP